MNGNPCQKERECILRHTLSTKHYTKLFYHFLVLSDDKVDTKRYIGIRVHGDEL